MNQFESANIKTKTEAFLRLIDGETFYLNYTDELYEISYSQEPGIKVNDDRHAIYNFMQRRKWHEVCPFTGKMGRFNTSQFGSLSIFVLDRFKEWSIESAESLPTRGSITDRLSKIESILHKHNLLK